MLVDFLRGVAALAVVLYHVPKEMRTAADLPSWLETIFANGSLGVNVFFVLSGFVIALSVAKVEWTFQFFGRFVVKRSVRLDPPYWVAIALEVCLGVIGMKILAAKSYPLPDLLDVLSHVTYTQEIFGRRQISDVFWTLCFEIQFYVATVAVLVLASTRVVTRVIAARTSLTLVFVSVVLLSASVRNGWIENFLPGSGLARAHEFLLGCLCYLLAAGKIRKEIGWSGLFAVVAIRALGGGYTDAAIMVGTFVVCLVAYARPDLDAMMNRPTLQFLGTISYSLYLFHASIVGRASSLFISRLGDSSPFAYGIALVVIVAGAILFAYLCYLAVERPALRFSRRIPIQGSTKPLASAG